MSATSPIAPKSVLRHRPIHADVVTEEPPRTRRASRTQDAIPPLTRVAPTPARSTSQPRVGPVSLGMGMLIAVAAVAVGQFMLNWVSVTWDDLHYGRPRTFQTDAFVGHETGNTPSHFIALNLHGRIEIIELPGGDPTHAKIYLGPQTYGPGAELVPVTLQFIDPLHNHHPEMLILFQGTKVVFHNVQGGFQPAAP